ncbi:MAG: methylated-DNA--[protein]-cysteine S-methyltransferase [Bacteroidales bacterium]
MSSMACAWLESPVGRLLVAGDDEGLRYVLFAEGRDHVEPKDGWVEDAGRLAEPLRQLTEYFSGGRRRFDLRLAPHGTPFQQRVWQELLTIPYGETRSYGELARQIGRPNASRAVGLANGANPISIVVPCHRVIGANGTLTGYGGGLKNKEWLLALERAQAAARLF